MILSISKVPEGIELVPIALKGPMTVTKGALCRSFFTGQRIAPRP